ncbi:MAG: molybdopterin-guanine dinucleotide biosynthesis protein MobB [Anaerovorax sp.]
MKVFSVYGICDSGKTMSIEKISAELRKRRYSVGSIKEIHYDQFAIDRKGSNTDRHKNAGAQLVTALGNSETDILYQKPLPLEEILKFYNQDIVVIEGNREGNFPKILAAHSLADIENQLDDTTFAITGVISNHITTYRGIPVINALEDISHLVDLIEEKIFERLPDFPPDCCCACGMSCRDLCKAIVKGKARREDCQLSKSNVQFFMDGNPIDMVPFVQRILENAVRGVVSQLEGYGEQGVIEIKIGF